MTDKSSVDQIRARFDADVERFSNLETGQAVAMDSRVHIELTAEAASACVPDAQDILDIGCGAGNYTLTLLERFPNANVTLVDLSRPMLDRAQERICEVSGRYPIAREGDIRDVDLGKENFDIIVAAQCLHHLRADDEWQGVFARVYDALRTSGAVFISDAVSHALGPIEQVMYRRWGDYLVQLEGAGLRDRVFANVEQEDTPRTLQYQLELMRHVGFAQIEVLHKHNRFALFGAVKGA